MPYAQILSLSKASNLQCWSKDNKYIPSHNKISRLCYDKVFSRCDIHNINIILSDLRKGGDNKRIRKREKKNYFNVGICSLSKIVMPIKLQKVRKIMMSKLCTLSKYYLNVANDLTLANHRTQSKNENKILTNVHMTDWDNSSIKKLFANKSGSNFYSIDKVPLFLKDTS